MTPLTVANGILLALGGLALVYFLGQLLSMVVVAWVDSLPEPEPSKETVELLNALAAISARADKHRRAVEDEVAQLTAAEWRRR
jgi:amino acid transporter